MKNMTIKNIAASCGGVLHNCEDILELEVTGVTTDSRKVEAGNLFIAMRGTHDGHDFVSSALNAGAACVVVEKADQDAAYPYIKVKKTAVAIQRIAEFYRMELGIPVVGITGSVGKTSTKEMIASVLAQKYNVLKTAGNFNNNLGLPLTIFRLREEHEIAVLEMGISHFGEMTDLARTARPDTMVITNIGTCHLEFLKDRDGVFEAKTECFEYVDFTHGVVVLNGEDDKLAQVDQVHGRAPIFYGRNASFRVYAENIVPHGIDGISCTICMDDREFDVMIPVPGRHQVLNALAGAAVGSVYGLTDEEIKAGIESLEPIGGRFRVLHKNGCTVIDDCYNANPMSMKASLSVLGDVEERTVAVLGDMGELGENESALHREVGEAAGGMAVDAFVLIGELSKNIAEGIRSVRPDADIVWFPTVPEAVPEITAKVGSGDVVLVKASHFMQFDRIVDALTK